MGTCHNCGKEVTLVDDQTKCDNCGKVLRYPCGSCKQWFKIEDKNQKVPLCTLCGFFKCPNCGDCSTKCIRYEWQQEMFRIMAPDFLPTQYPVLRDKVRKIVDHIEKTKIENLKRNCIKQVPISYAKGKTKVLLARIEGYRVRDERDKKAFIARIDKITNKPIGTTFTVNKIKARGTYGQEERDAFNLLVCLGKLKITIVPETEKHPEYAVYERIDAPACQYLSKEDVLIYDCPKCKKIYDKTFAYCPNCTYKKGKYKGQAVNIRIRINNNDTCTMHRGDFIKKEKK